jgi:hypothetical protein
VEITRDIVVRVTIPKDTVEEAEAWFDYYFPKGYTEDSMKNFVGDVEHKVTIEPVVATDEPEDQEQFVGY